jgi:hypothetical protein
MKEYEYEDENDSDYETEDAEIYYPNSQMRKFQGWEIAMLIVTVCFSAVSLLTYALLRAGVLDSQDYTYDKSNVGLLLFTYSFEIALGLGGIYFAHKGFSQRNSVYSYRAMYAIIGLGLFSSLMDLVSAILKSNVASESAAAQRVLKIVTSLILIVVYIFLLVMMNKGIKGSRGAITALKVFSIVYFVLCGLTVFEVVTAMLWAPKYAPVLFLGALALIGTEICPAMVFFFLPRAIGFELDVEELAEEREQENYDEDGQQ